MVFHSNNLQCSLVDTVDPAKARIVHMISKHENTADATKHII